jgi:hypothetical protein
MDTHKYTTVLVVLTQQNDYNKGRENLPFILGGNHMNYYRIDYFSKRKRCYTYKVVKARSYDEAIKKSRVKNIEDIELVGIERRK